MSPCHSSCLPPSFGLLLGLSSVCLSLCVFGSFFSVRFSLEPSCAQYISKPFSTLCQPRSCNVPNCIFNLVWAPLGGLHTVKLVLSALWMIFPFGDSEQTTGWAQAADRGLTSFYVVTSKGASVGQPNVQVSSFGMFVCVSVSVCAIYLGDAI